MVAPALTAHVTSPRARAGVSAVLTTAALLVLIMLVLWPLAAVVVTGVEDLARVGLAPLGAFRRTLEELEILHYRTPPVGTETVSRIPATTSQKFLRASSTTSGCYIWAPTLRPGTTRLVDLAGS